MSFFLLVVGLLGLWIGADLLVLSSKALAKRLGVSDLLIGLTIVSIGVSLPEIMVSSFSGYLGASGIAVGSIIGSCLAQISLITGIAGLIHNIKATRKALHIDGTMMLLVIAIFWIFGFTGDGFSRGEGVISIIFYIAYLIFTARHDELASQKREAGRNTETIGHTFLLFLMIMAGLGILFFSAQAVLKNALSITGSFGFSQTFLGVMVIGVATCLPELSAAVIGVLRKAPGISVGALIGSNITDPLFSIGIGAGLFGFKIEDPRIFYFDIPFWFFATILMLYLMKRKRLTLNRVEASILVIVYGVFVVTKIVYFA